MAKDVADISGRLAIPRYTARAFDCTWTGIVGCDSEVNHAEPVEHLPQIPRRAEDIGHGVKAIEDAEFLCRCWHQLAKARSACRADSKGVIAGFRENTGNKRGHGSASLTGLKRGQSC